MFMTAVTSSRHNPRKTIVNHLCPAEGRGREVAKLTCGCGREVVRRLDHDPPDPGQPGPVARRAARRDARVVHRSPAERCRRFVAKLTGTRRWEVVRWFGHNPADPRLTGSMAGRAARRDAAMVHGSPAERQRRSVAEFTGTRRRKVV